MQFLNSLQTTGTIQLTYDPSIQPHGIARIDVFDPEFFRRCRIRSGHCLLRMPIRIALTSDFRNHATSIENNTSLLHRSARLRWFQREDITGSGGESEPPGHNRELENGVKQAFRRCLCPSRPAHLHHPLAKLAISCPPSLHPQLLPRLFGQLGS